MSILCAVDFSRPSAVALAVAGRIASTFGQRLTVITVADPLLAAAERMHSGDDPLTLMAQALGEFVNEALGPGSAARHTLAVPIGDPAGEILRQADALDAGLVVLGTQGASGVSKFVFGSVAERVLRHTTRPALVVPPSAATAPARTIGSLQEVLAPIDFHEHAIEDARVASRVARASHARLRLLHVAPGDEDDRWTILRQPLAQQLDEELSGARQSQADRAYAALERLAESLGTPAPVLEITQGPVADQIVKVADRLEVDLLVLGLRGTPGVTGARVGSIAYRVLCASPVPVLALPHEARQGEALAFLERGAPGSRPAGPSAAG